MNNNIAIIGGGIAGMEAARQLLALGYKPYIIEKSDHLGGHVADWHKLFPDMLPAKDIVKGLVKDCRKASILLNAEIVSINRLKNSYNIILGDGHPINVGAVLVASGFKLFDAQRKEEYGYGIYNNVVTNSDLEKWFAGKEDRRIPEKVTKVGFVHCVGSRDLKAGNSQCSKVCCMTAIKQAMELKEKFPLADIYCFYMDLRLFGKKYEDFYIDAQSNYNIHFVRGRVSEVSETIDGRLMAKAEDTLSGKPVKITLDMLVLMSGMLCNPDADTFADMLRLEKDSDGYLSSLDNITGVTSSNHPGIFYAGACTGTKTVPETISEARAAALEIHNYLKD